MRNTLRQYAHSFIMAIFGVWIFLVWRLAGMPDPGFAGRIIPAAWLLAAILNGKEKQNKWFVPIVLSFTTGAWLWMLYPDCWIIAAAIPVAGLIAWAFSISGSHRVIRAVLPLLLLSVITAEINGDEVRFAEHAAAVSGFSSERFSQSHFRTGDISLEEGHHTPFFPMLIAPGLLAGDTGLRLIPLILSLLGVLLLAKLTEPRIAVAAALLYPGLSILGLAMTGWFALGLFTFGVLLPEGKKWSAIRFFIALLLVALKMRYIGLSAGILIAEYSCMPTGNRKKKWLIPAAWIGGGLFILALDRYILGGVIFWSRYGNIEAVRLLWANVIQQPLVTLSHAGWSLFDPEAGLIPRAPWVLAAISGLFIFRRNHPSRFKRLFIPSLFYWLFLIAWSGPSWHGLPAPAGRIFVPMLPLFACGLASVWNKKETRILLILSIAISALVIASPVCRYNYADGTDSILTLIGTSSGFSMVRADPLLLLVPLFLAVSMVIVITKGGKYRGFSYVIILTAVFLISLSATGYEAEDLPTEMVQGARLYPYISDPVERFFWFGSRERILEVAEPGQSILLPGVEAGDTLFIELSGGGGLLSVGENLFTVETPLMELPSLFRSIGRTTRILPDWPENRAIEVFTVPLNAHDVNNSTVRISHHSGPPVYMDRIDISKKLIE
ncbi:MAG: hypothetical protein KAH54_02515 [Candidatus Sabulitectum sp.]|nr:hypothetical protein [Candidatus Sabulitectum sp.]